MDMKEIDVIFGGEKKLSNAIDELVGLYHPPVIFVYSTCIVGIIGDDLEAICNTCLLYTSPSPRDGLLSRMPSSA